MFKRLLSTLCFLFAGVGLGLALASLIAGVIAPMLVYLAWSAILATSAWNLRKMGY